MQYTQPYKLIFLYATALLMIFSFPGQLEIALIMVILPSIFGFRASKHDFKYGKTALSAAFVLSALLTFLMDNIAAVQGFFLIALPEEYFFRTIYFNNPFSKDKLKNCVMNGLIFSFFHGILNSGFLPWLTFFPGFILARIYDKKPSLYLVAMIHWTMNLLYSLCFH
jgi:membrane protease YdiL (CAAX protease family)